MMLNNRLKRTLITVAFIVTLTPFVLAQKNYRVYLQGGIRDISLDQTEVFFQFVDSSPSMDNITSQVSLNPISSPFLGGIGFIGDINDKISAKLEVNGFFQSDLLGLSLDIGAGYIIQLGKFRVTPELLLSIGGSFTSLGRIQNNDLFIQINETQFFESSLSVRLQDTYIGIKPNISLELDLFGPIGIIGQVGFTGAIGRPDTTIRFQSVSEGSEEVEVTDPNVNLLINNEAFEDSIIGFSNLSLSAGVVYKIR